MARGTRLEDWVTIVSAGAFPLCCLAHKDGGRFDSTRLWNDIVQTAAVVWSGKNMTWQ